jgi:hypothetical protein
MSGVTHPVQVGSSLSGALWALDSSNLTDALELINQALCQAKHAGKNCTVFHAELNA